MNLEFAKQNIFCRFQKKNRHNCPKWIHMSVADFKSFWKRTVTDYFYIDINTGPGRIFIFKMQLNKVASTFKLTFIVAAFKIKCKYCNSIVMFTLPSCSCRKLLATLRVFISGEEKRQNGLWRRDDRILLQKKKKQIE